MIPKIGRKYFTYNLEWDQTGLGQKKLIPSWASNLQYLRIVNNLQDRIPKNHRASENITDKMMLLNQLEKVKAVLR